MRGSNHDVMQGSMIFDSLLRDLRQHRSWQDQPVVDRPEAPGFELILQCSWQEADCLLHPSLNGLEG